LAERFTYAVVFPVEEGKIRFPDTVTGIAIGSDFVDFGKNRMLLADAWNILIDGEAELSGFEAEYYSIFRKPGRILLSVRGFERPEFLDADFNALRRAREDALDDVSRFAVDSNDPAMQTTVTRAWEVLKACVYAPEEKFTGFWATPDRYPHRQCWIMDSVYQSLGMRYFRQDVAQDQVCALLAHQCDDGRVPMQASPENVIRAQTQQPVIAQGVKAVGIHGEKLRAIYPALSRYLDWLFAHRDQDGDGLLEWLMGGGYPLCPCGESGMDNSPRFDERNPLAAVDLNSLVSLECEIMAEFAAELGLAEDQKMWTARHEKLNALMEKYFWNEKLGIYCDMDIADERLIPVSTVSGFMPLICKAASPERAAKLAALVRDPKEYGSRYPLPSVSLSDPRFQMDMWRGPVWHIFNYHVAEGLDRYGYHAEATLIRRKTVEAGLRYAQEFGGFFEFYDPSGIVPPAKISRKGKNAPCIYHHAVHDYGWSASIFLDMLYKINH